VTSLLLHPFPFGGAPPFAVSYAFALAPNKVRVLLTAPALRTSATTPGSALRPASWTVQRLDTGAFLPVAFVEAVTPQAFDLTLGTNLGGATTQHRASALGVVNEAGSPISSPTFADFAGLRTALLAGTDPPPSDFRNWSAPRNPAGGTLQIGTDGDYRMESGTDYERKMIIRRLTTERGGFFYLPDYGAGIAAKNNVSAANLPRLQREIQRQVGLEPTVASARVQVTLQPAYGIMNIVVAARLRSGPEVNATVAQSTA